MSIDTRLSRILPVAALACGALMCSSAIAGAPALDVVVYSGLANSPPGFPGLFWNLSSGFTNPVIDEAGKIAFVGTIFGDGITPANNRVMWYGGESNWTVVARNGNPALPGLPGLTTLAVGNNSPGLSSNGNILVSSSLAGGGVTTANDTAFWYGPLATPSLVARESTTVAPGPDGAVLSSSFGALGLGNSYRANNAGQVFFSSNLSGGTPAVTAANNFGTYIGSSSGVTEVWRKGNPIPGAPPLPAADGPFMTPDTFGFALNGAGEVVHTGTLVAGTAGGVAATNDKVVYTTAGGPMRIVVREGSEIPGLAPLIIKASTTFTLATMCINNAGKVLFNATVDLAGTTTANDTGWLVDDHGTVSFAVREGDAIDGETFNAANALFLTNGDRLVIVGNAIAATNPGRLWTGPLGGPYTKVIEQGVTEVPGSPGVFLNFSAGSANAAVNSAGQVVFSSPLTGAGVIPGENDVAIFGWDPTDGLVMIARTGVTSIPQLLDLSQLALIGGTGITGDNGSAILTDNGWLVVRFQDVKGFQAIVRTRPFETSCSADVNGNGQVDVDDLVAVILAWGACADPQNCPQDTDGNGMVDVDDLAAVILAWGPCR